MKAAHMLIAVAVALAATLSEASLGTGPMAATAPSRLDSSAGSHMGPAGPANVDPNAPTKPGSIPVTTTPDNGGDKDGGVAGGFAADTKNTTVDGSGKTDSSTITTQPTTKTSASPSPVPTTTKSGAMTLSAASVVTIVSVSATAAALVW